MMGMGGKEANWRLDTNSPPSTRSHSAFPPRSFSRDFMVPGMRPESPKSSIRLFSASDVLGVKVLRGRKGLRV